MAINCFPVEGAIYSQSSWPRNVTNSEVKSCFWNKYMDLSSGKWIQRERDQIKDPIFCSYYIINKNRILSNFDYQVLNEYIEKQGKEWNLVVLAKLCDQRSFHNHSQSWSPKSQKYDLKLIMIVIWSEIIGNHDDFDLALADNSTLCRPWARAW